MAYYNYWHIQSCLNNFSDFFFALKLLLYTVTVKYLLLYKRYLQLMTTPEFIATLALNTKWIFKQTLKFGVLNLIWIFCLFLLLFIKKQLCRILSWTGELFFFFQNTSSVYLQRNIRLYENDNFDILFTAKLKLFFIKRVFFLWILYYIL